ncbi:uncharacterized protein LOC134281614 [Saccostrea cucullata]|uniref:uncharacterized protein LOC134281614 n=1 Tax=Saccostrea cuccullata TaxID=36930 RepID=UPI002ED58FEB
MGNTSSKEKSKGMSKIQFGERVLLEKDVDRGIPNKIKKKKDGTIEIISQQEYSQLSPKKGDPNVVRDYIERPLIAEEANEEYNHLLPKEAHKTIGEDTRINGGSPN